MLKQIVEVLSNLGNCKPYCKLEKSGVYPSERVVYQDSFTHTFVWKMTHDPSVDRHVYYDIPAWNANGSKIIFMSTRPGTGTGFWIMDANGSNIRELKILKGRMRLRPPIFWSNQDPNKIYFAMDDDEKTEILSMDILSGEMKTIGTIYEPGFDIMPSSPDDKKILLRKKYYGVGGFYEEDKVYILDVETGLIERVPIPGKIHRIRFTKAPDYSIFFKRRTDQSLWIINVDGSNMRKLRVGGGHPDWSPDGSKFSFFYKGLRVLSRDGSDEKTLVDGISGHGGWTYDGEWLLVDVSTHCKSTYAGKILLVKKDGSESYVVCAHNSSYQGHREHPYSESTHANATASPDGTKVIFNSDMHGLWSNVYVAVIRYPDPPERLKASIQDGKIVLTWDKPRRSREIMGYNMYRSETSGINFVQINSAPIKEEKFIDHSAAKDKTYYYVVTSMEYSGLESRFSNEAFIPPDPEHVGPIRYWYEAEEGSIRGSVTRILDGRASENYYVFSTRDGEGLIRIPVYVPRRSRYLIWCRVFSEKMKGKLKISVDGENEASIEVVSNAWQWHRALEHFMLEAGEHDVTISIYGKGLGIDNILITDDEKYVPSFLGWSRDRIPPKRVRGLRAETAGLHEILVSWMPNNELDIDHYNVYRSTNPDFECNYETLIASPSNNNYLDWGLKPLTTYYSPTTYYYQVTAVDRAGNESEPSEVVSAKIGARSKHIDWE